MKHKQRVCSYSNKEPYAWKCQECREFNNVIMINLDERMKSTTHDECNKLNEIPKISRVKYGAILFILTAVSDKTQKDGSIKDTCTLEQFV